MRWLEGAIRGAFAGMALMLALYGVVLFSLWAESAGASDAITTVLREQYGDLINRAVWRFFLLHLLAGGLLGVAAGILGELLAAPIRRGCSLRRTLFVHLLASLGLFLYLNVRFLVNKPMFYDPLLNANGGLGRWLQNSLTAHLSPRGVDLLFLLLLIGLFVLLQGRRKGTTPLAGGAAVPGSAAFPGTAALPGIAALVALFWLLPGQAEPGKAPAAAPGGGGRPNILVLGCDSLRPDHLSCYGYPEKTSPHIDALAQKSVCFDQAYVPLARTLPAWVSLLTSTYPHTHGFRHMFPAREKRKIHLPLLTRILAAEGYESAVISDYAGECFDMVDMGFTIRDVPPATSVQVVIERQFLRRQPYLVPFLDHPAGYRLLPLLGFLMINPDPWRMTDRVIEAMQNVHATGQPFFISAFFSCTHIPYALPYPYYKMYTDPDYRGIHKYGFGIGDVREIAKAMERPPEADQRHIANLYDGGVTAFDDAVGAVLEELVRLGIAENTMILVLSDHGENLYDHGNLLEHGDRFGGGDAANRIPLILYDPTGEFTPRHADAAVDLVDVMPTLLSRLSLPLPAVAQGTDLTPLMRGKAVAARPLFAETGLMLNGTPEGYEGSDLEYPDILSSLDADPLDGTLYLKAAFEGRAVSAKQRQLRLGRYKLIYVPTSEGADFHLYDVETDPGNGEDLYGRPGYEEVSQTLKRKLFACMLEEPGTGLDRKLHLIRRYTFME